MIFAIIMLKVLILRTGISTGIEKERILIKMSVKIG